MKLVALMPCRNEDWVVGLSARVALMWCDSLVIYCHSCTDHSKQIALELFEEYGTRVTVILDDETIWHEMQQRQRMLECARRMGATHIAIVDADEILTGNLLYDNIEYIRNSVKIISEGVILQLPGYNLRGRGIPSDKGGIGMYHSTGIWGNRWFSVAFPDSPVLSWTGERFHHREPMGMPLTPYKPIAQHVGGVMHLWGASERRLRAKSAHYKLTERLMWPNKPVQEIDRMYSWAIRGLPERNDTPAQWQFKAVPEQWWAPYKHLMHHLHLEADPWQEADARRIVADNPGIDAGMDLFGVV